MRHCRVDTHHVARLGAAVLAAIIMAAGPLETAQNPLPALPPRLETYLARTVRLTANERKRLSDGAPVTKLLDANDSAEVTVFGAIWIAGSTRQYVDAVKNIETFERGGRFKITRAISNPPRLDDFADLHLSDEDLRDLRGCRLGNCEVKLGEQALHRFRTEIDWKSPTAREAADALMQRIALEYVTGYLEGGNERLAVYRDSSRPTFVAQEFRSMADQMPELTTIMPEMRRYLLEYPKVSLPGATSLLYWQETEFGLKPTIRISHLTIHEGPDDTVVTSKMLYASHYFWTGLEVRALVPDPKRGTGFWFVTVNRSRSDGLSGFTGIFIRRRVRSEVLRGTLAILQRTRETFASSK